MVTPRFCLRSPDLGAGANRPSGARGTRGPVFPARERTDDAEVALPLAAAGALG